MKKIIGISAVVLVVAIVITSFAIYAKTSLTDDCISVDEAKTIALTHAPDSKISKIKLEYDDGIMEYEIDMYDDAYNYEVKLNAVTGTLTNIEKSMIKTKKSIPTDLMNIDDILNIVYDDAGYKAADVAFVTYELDRDDGVYMYEIEFYADGAKYDYEISATDGTIYEFEVEYSL